MNGCLANKGTPTVHEYPSFDADSDAHLLRTALKGLGTDEKSIIAVVSQRSLRQRLIISERYEFLFGRDLKADLKSETSRHFKDLLMALFTDSAIYDAKSLKMAMRGPGTKEEILVEIITSRSNDQIKAIQEQYENLYKVTLEADIRDDTSKEFQKFMLDFSKGEREESDTVDTEVALKDAKELYATNDKWGAEDCLLIRLIISKPMIYLKAVFDNYKNLSSVSMEQAIHDQFTVNDDLQSALKKITRYILHPHAYFANELYKSMKGIGTRDTNLIRLVVTRCEIDMGEIKKAYKLLNQIDLKTAIEKDTHGDYKTLLIALIS